MAKRGVPAESARLEARHAGIKAGLGRGSALLVGELLLRRERHVQKHLRRKHEHIRLDTVPAHPVFALLHGLVEAKLLLLRNTIEHNLVVHGRLDVALGAEILGAV